MSYETVYEVDLAALPTIKLQGQVERRIARHRALGIAPCNHCSEPNALLLQLAPTVVDLGGVVATCVSCAYFWHGVSVDCFGRLSAELRGDGRRG